MTVRLTTCRSCGSYDLKAVIDLGSTPLANRLLTAAELDQPEPYYPLELVLCGDCALLQLTVTVPPELLFSNYPYLSSYSDTLVRHAQALSRRLMQERDLGPTSLVVEAASNDGYLLGQYAQAGVPVLGIEPATNVAAVAIAKGIPTRNQFFGVDVARQMAAEGVAADVVHAHNVLAHVPDLNGFVEGLATILKPGGVAVVEAPHVVPLIEGLEFDTIYHEHLCYFSLSSLVPLFERHGLRVLSAECIDIHGGSLRLIAGRTGTPDKNVAILLAEEQGKGATGIDFYLDFSQRVSKLASRLSAELRNRKLAGHRIAAYGASAKGCTLMHRCGINADVLDYVVDRSDIKQGRFLPGTHLPVRDPSILLSDRPDDVLLLTWNFAKEILLQQAQYRAAGGRFIVPLPEILEV